MSANVPRVLLVSRPGVDYDTLLGVIVPALGRNPAGAVDGAHRPVGVLERWGLTLSGILDEHAAGVAPAARAHTYVTLLLLVDPLDAPDVVSCLGVPVIYANTVRHDVQVILATANLNQWRDAVSALHPPGEVQKLFDEIRAVFHAHGNTL